MIKKIILDVLKPQNPTIIEFSQELVKIPGVKSIEVTNVELDREVEKIKLIIVGKISNFSLVRKVIENLGASIHSIDGILVEKSK